MQHYLSTEYTKEDKEALIEAGFYIRKDGLFEYHDTESMTRIVILPQDDKLHKAEIFTSIYDEDYGWDEDYDKIYRKPNETLHDFLIDLTGNI